ncbi:MAG: hypothetical protein ABI615_08470 [Chthoniobacterales bacterium]
MDILLKFLPSILSKLAVAAFLFGFWWPIRKQTYGKSVPWLIAIFALSFFLSSVAYPTYTRHLGQVLQTLGTAHSLIPSVIFWTTAICDSLFVLLIVVMVLSDVANLLPSEFRQKSCMHRFLVETYSHITFVGIALLLLRLLPLGVIFYCTSTLKSF